MHPTKLGIIGIGHVGAQVLTNAAKSHLFGEIVLIDTRTNVAWGEAEDHSHAQGLHSRANVNIYAGTYDDLSDADIIIISATYMYKPDDIPTNRQQLLLDNVSIIRQIMRDIVARTQDAILIFITNPVDTVAYMAVEEFGYPANRVIGTGCMLDSSRLRHTIAKHYQIDPHAVTGYMLGEHGVSAFPVLSHVSVGGVSYSEFQELYPDVPKLTRQTLQQHVVEVPYEVFRAKNGVTDAAIAQVAIELTQHVVLDEKAIVPVGAYLNKGQYGITNSVTLSTPCVIGKNGIEKIFEISLDHWEQEQMANTITVIQSSIANTKA